MRYSSTSTGWRAYMKGVLSRSVLTTMAMWIHRVMLATMQAELVPWQNMQGYNGTRSEVGRVL
jgi:hypothetical protein